MEFYKTSNNDIRINFTSEIDVIFFRESSLISIIRISDENILYTEFCPSCYSPTQFRERIAQIIANYHFSKYYSQKIFQK